MNRRQALSVMVASAGALLPSVADACEMSFKPGTVRADGNGKARFTAMIFLDHRRCVIGLPPDCINMEASGLKVLKQSGWSKVRRGRYRNELVVQLSGRQGSLRIWRDCSKKGVSEGVLVVRS